MKDEIDITHGDLFIDAKGNIGVFLGVIENIPIGRMITINHLGHVSPRKIISYKDMWFAITKDVHTSDMWKAAAQHRREDPIRT